MEAAGYLEKSAALYQLTGCQYLKTASAIFTAVKPDNSRSDMQSNMTFRAYVCANVFTAFERSRHLGTYINFPEYSSEIMKNFSKSSVETCANVTTFPV